MHTYLSFGHQAEVAELLEIFNMLAEHLQMSPIRHSEVLQGCRCPDHWMVCGFKLGSQKTKQTQSLLVFLVDQTRTLNKLYIVQPICLLYNNSFY